MGENVEGPSVLGMTLNVLAIINFSVGVAASIFREIALFMRSKVRLQCFFEIFLTVTF
jgi:hypothetical protein